MRPVIKLCRMAVSNGFHSTDEQYRVNGLRTGCTLRHSKEPELQLAAIQFLLLACNIRYLVSGI